jgi:hypothetical protein
LNFFFTITISSSSLQSKIKNGPDWPVQSETRPLSGLIDHENRSAIELDIKPENRTKNRINRENGRFYTIHRSDRKTCDFAILVTKKCSCKLQTQYCGYWLGC